MNSIFKLLEKNFLEKLENILINDVKKIENSSLVDSIVEISYDLIKNSDEKIHKLIFHEARRSNIEIYRKTRS